MMTHSALAPLRARTGTCQLADIGSPYSVECHTTVVRVLLLIWRQNWRARLVVALYTPHRTPHRHTTQLGSTALDPAYRRTSCCSPPRTGRINGSAVSSTVTDDCGVRESAVIVSAPGLGWGWDSHVAVASGISLGVDQLPLLALGKVQHHNNKNQVQQVPYHLL